MPTSLQSILVFGTLLLAPILGTLLISLVDSLIGREIPPILPQINSQSFGQALVTMVVLGVVDGETNTRYVLVAALIIIALFIVLLIQAKIDKDQQEETQRHVRTVLLKHFRSKFTESKLNNVLDIAKSMIDVDYIPESLPNRWSGFPRQVRREQFLNIVKSYLGLEDGEQTDVNQLDLLVPEDERKRLNRAYFRVTVSSFSLYLLSIWLSLYGR